MFPLDKRRKGDLKSGFASFAARQSSSIIVVDIVALTWHIFEARQRKYRQIL
jgi:hypothetical protein